MTRVRVLAGTAKGAFIFESDGKREQWEFTGPHFGGWEVYHLTGSPADPDRLFASQSTAWFGQLVQRSDDGGATWAPMSNEFAYEGPVGSHLASDGSQQPWTFNRIWHLEPSYGDPDTIYAGAADAAVFVSTDGAKSWQELPGLRRHESVPAWQPGAGGMCLHTILLEPDGGDRMFVAISAAGVFRSDDSGQTWRPANRGLRTESIPDPEAEVGHCVHRLGRHPAYPDVLFMQKHWGVMRSDDGGGSWYEISGNLPSDFGYTIQVHPHEPQTVFVVPITSDAEHYTPDGMLRVYRSRSGGGEWEALSNGLPQRGCYTNVLRDAMGADSLDEAGLYFGTTGGQLYASPDAGETWSAIARDLPRVLSVHVQTLP